MESNLVYEKLIRLLKYQNANLSQHFETITPNLL